jgi:hypothetical protein
MLEDPAVTLVRTYPSLLGEAQADCHLVHVLAQLGTVQPAQAPEEHQVVLHIHVVLF